MKILYISIALYFGGVAFADAANDAQSIERITDVLTKRVTSIHDEGRFKGAVSEVHSSGFEVIERDGYEFLRIAPKTTKRFDRDGKLTYFLLESEKREEETRFYKNRLPIRFETETQIYSGLVKSHSYTNCSCY